MLDNNISATYIAIHKRLREWKTALMRNKLGFHAAIKTHVQQLSCDKCKMETQCKHTFFKLVIRHQTRAWACQPSALHISVHKHEKTRPKSTHIKIKSIRKTVILQT